MNLTLNEFEIAKYQGTTNKRIEIGNEFRSAKTVYF